MIKYEVRFESESHQHMVVAFRAYAEGKSACGDIVYRSYDEQAAQNVQDSLQLDQDPAYLKWLAKLEAYAFEECV